MCIRDRLLPIRHVNLFVRVQFETYLDLKNTSYTVWLVIYAFRLIIALYICAHNIAVADSKS